jgi:hypothetical protein
VKHVRNRPRPSPALVVAIAALCVGLVGTAIAGPIAQISLNKQEKKQIRKIAAKLAQKIATRRINQLAPGLAVASAQTANLANTVANDAITTEKLADAAVTPAELADAAVTLAKLAGNSVDGSKVVDNSLFSADLGPNSVTSSEIATNAVNATEIADNSIDGGEIVNGGLSDVDVGNASGTFVFDAGSIAANGCTLNVVEVGGIDNNDHVLVSPPSTIMALDVSVTAGRAASNNFFRLNFCNPTGAAINPPSATYAFVTINQ